MATKSAMKIGVLIDFLNGEQAGRILRDALALGFDEALAKGLIDRPVELVFREVDGLPRGNFNDVLIAYRELVAEGVLGVYGPKISENAIALRKYVENEAQVPTISMTGTDLWYGEWCFCLNNGSLPEDGYLMTNYLTSKAVKTVAVVYDRSAIGIEYMSFFRDACRFDGIEIISEQSVAQTADDLSAEAFKLKEADADAVAYLGFGLPAVHLNTAFTALDWNPLRVMNTSFMTAAALPQGIQALRGWIGIDQYDEENLVGQRMLDRFEARFGYRPQNFWSVLNYDFANIIAHGLSMAHPLSPEGFKHGLERIKFLPTATGGPNAVVSFGPYMRRAWVTADFLIMREVDPTVTAKIDRMGPPGTILRHRYTAIAR